MIVRMHGGHLRIFRTYTATAAILGLFLASAIFFGAYTWMRSSGMTAFPRSGAYIAEQDVTKELVNERMRLMSQWVSSNQRADGSLPYLYEPATGNYPDGQNLLRQYLTVQGLFAVARTLHDEELEARAMRAQGFLMENYYRDDAQRAIGYIIEADGAIKLGTSAVALLALREGKDDSMPLTAQEQALGAYLLSAQRSDGSFQTFLQEQLTNENDRFYSGESLMALVRLYDVSKEKKYLDALAKSRPYYREKLEREFFPQYAPWHIQAYTLAYVHTNSHEDADYVYFLADRLIETMLESDLNAHPGEKGRFFNPDNPQWGAPHSSSTGIYTEGLTYAYALALKRGDTERAARYKVAMVSGMRSLLQVQWTKEMASASANPERLVGSLMRTVGDDRHRIDQTGHAANAFARFINVIVD